MSTANPTQPRRRTPRPRQASAYTSAKLYGPRRCPQCNTSLRHLPLVTDTNLRVAEVVMRRLVDGQPTTSSDLAALWGIPINQASDMLRDATARSLVLRRQKVALPRGGMQWSHSGSLVATAYVESDTLAAQGRDLFASMRRKLERAERELGTRAERAG